ELVVDVLPAQRLAEQVQFVDVLGEQHRVQVLVVGAAERGVGDVGQYGAVGAAAELDLFASAWPAVLGEVGQRGPRCGDVALVGAQVGERVPGQRVEVGVEHVEQRRVGVEDGAVGAGQGNPAGCGGVQRGEDRKR